jgi:ATP:ADP antiporter, AAA family
VSFLGRVQGAVNVRPGEGRTAGLMLAHSFFMGLSTVFFETAASALFLERFGPGVLPFVYIVAAALNTATGVVYAAMQERVSFGTLMSGTLVFLLATTVALRAGLGVSEAGGLVFALLVWYRAVSALTDLEYWAVAGHLFDVRQAKRLFGFIGSGEVVARIAGSFAIPALVHAFGVPNLLALSAGALFMCLLLLGAVLHRRRAAEAMPARRSATLAKRAGWREALATLRDRYLLLIFALSFFGVLAKYFVDFAFLAEMKSRFGDAKGLASFFALFSGVSQILSLLTRMFVSGRLLDRYGIRTGLLVLPATQVACTLLVVVAGAAAIGPPVVFWLVIANQGIYKTLKHPIDSPSFKVLYQPLRKERRLAAQIAVDMLVTPVTIGIAGLVMLLFTRVWSYDPSRFAWAMLLDFGGWLVVAALAGGAYARALTEALKRRLDDEHAFELLSDEASRGALRRRLAGGREDEILPALDLLDKGDHRELDDAVVPLLDHSAVAVRRAALAYVERHRPPRAADAVRRRFEAETRPAVRAAVLRCLCALDRTASLAAFLDHASAELRRAATIGLLTTGNPAAEERVATRMRSPSAADRLWAAQVVGEAALPRLHALLRPLLEDADAAVRRAALLAAGRLRAPELWPAVAESLGPRRFAGAAAAALGAGGVGVIDDLEVAFGLTRQSHVRAQIARVWGRIGGPRATGLLRERLGFPDARVRYEVLVGLRGCGYRAEEGDVEGVESMIQAEAADAAWKLAVWRDLGDGAPAAMVRSALETEVRAGRERVLLLLSFVRDAHAISRAADNLAHESRDRRAYALEMLDVTLPADWRPALMPLFEDLTAEQRGEQLAAVFPQESRAVDARLKELLRQPPGRLASWTVASVLHATVGLDVDGASGATGGDSGSTLLRETAEWAKAQRHEPVDAETKGRGRPSMLTIEKVLILKAVQMFAQASEEILADVASIVEEVDVGAGEPVFAKGEAGDSMYVIVDGAVRIHDGARTITELGARDIFGELALLDPEPRLASVSALAPTRLLRLDREAFLELMEGNIEIVRGVLHVLCERLRRASAERPYVDPRPETTRG